MKSRLVMFVLSSVFFSNAWADMFCPSNFNSINVGDSIDSVIAACGKPDSQVSNKEKAPQPQEWSYYIATTPGQPGTMKLTIAFDATGTAINISVNGSGMPQTQICNGNQIQLGDNTKAVEAACGKAAYVNQAPTADTGPEPATEITVMTYKGSPPVTLTFENGKLVSRQ